MSSSSQDESSINRLCKRLQELEDISYFPETSRDTVKFLKREIKFLNIFLFLQNESNILDVTPNIDTLFENALLDLSQFHLAEYFEFCTFKIQHKIWLTKMEIRAKYSLTLMPSCTSVPLSSKFVTQFINTVVENLVDLVDDPSSFLYVPETKGYIENVIKELNLLQTFVCFVSVWFIAEPQSQHQGVTVFFTHVLAMAAHASMLAWFYFSGHGYKDQDVALAEINVLLFLQMKFNPIQPSIRKIYIAILQVLKSTKQPGCCSNIQNEHLDIEACFLETILHNLEELPAYSCLSQRVALKDQLAILQNILNFLRADIIHVAIQDLEPLLRGIDPIIVDVALLVYSLYQGEEEVNQAEVLDLSGRIQLIISTVIYPTIRKAFISNLPKIHGLGYADLIINNLKDFQNHHSDSLASVRNQFQIIQRQLESLLPFLEAVAEERHNGLDKIQTLIDKAYEVEYLVDACISQECPLWCLERWLLDIIKEITLIRKEVAEIPQDNLVRDAMDTVTAQTSSNLVRSPRMNEEFVGFKDVIEKLRYQLISGTKGLDIISIVGMPGLGKTTLANRLYDDTSIVSYFDSRAQYCVSRVYSRKNLLLAILCDVIGEDYCESRQVIAEGNLADELRRALLSKRYLILLDDVWEASAWDDLQGCFQDTNNGSRIILTTRNQRVADYAKIQSEPLPLRMFSDAESWELLEKKVFGKESCSPFLKDIGQKIAESCGRLPLSIALVAGFLANTEKKQNRWEHVANNLSPYIHIGSRGIIEHSYQSLPYHLRSCLLYFGAFLEDENINVLRLKMLWISEGFVKSCKGRSLEDVAEGYLEDLIGRNLVVGTKRSYGGKIEVCHIHDLLHDFCQERAKEENFLHCRNRQRWYQNVDSPSPVCCHKQLAHRLSIYDEWHHIREWSPCWSHVGSILLHRCIVISHHYFRRFKFLKVLDLGSTDIDSFPTGLIYLRYFSARTRFYSISSFIAMNSGNLETLMVENSENFSLPLVLWKMVNLRHLHIVKCEFATTGANKFLSNSNNLYNLQTLSTPTFWSVEEMEWIFGRAPNLRELTCKFDDHFSSISSYDVLNFPTQIEKLNISSNVISSSVLSGNIPFCISAPNLKQLVLCRFNLHPKHLSAIASLDNLQELELQEVKFVDSKWDVGDDEFPQLKVLKVIESIRVASIREWTVADNAFPNLECLVLRECQHLEKIPSCFGEILSLKSIEVKKCNKLVDKSARDIQETQVEDNQNSCFQVFIKEREEISISRS